MQLDFKLLLLLFVTIAISTAPAEEPSETRKPLLRERALEMFDKDGDGKLSAAERAEIRKFLRERRETRTDDRQPERMTWKVAELDREALVYLSTKRSDDAVPLVFGFHGHGGSAQQAARSYGLHQLWPEAIVVYMQGVPTVGRLTDPEGKRNGWQHDADENSARDLKFFDAVLATIREKQNVDNRRIYATGHSNGGGFTYLLWANRPDVFAAIAPSAAGSRSLRTSKPKPVPVLHVAGKQDQLVKYTWQQFTMQRVREINKCGNEGKQWVKGCTIYSAEDGAPFVSYIHDGTHKYPAEAPALIVRFFKEHTQPTKAASP
jgi:polyhydroxybutyrate depolymerase